MEAGVELAVEQEGRAGLKTGMGEAGFLDWEVAGAFSTGRELAAVVV